MRFQSLVCLAMAGTLAACSGGGGNVGSGSSTTKSMQRITGTIAVAFKKGTKSHLRALSHARRPDYISSATTQAAVFIGGDTTPDGSTSSCSSSGCTITWSTNQAVPATLEFLVEADDGTTILSVGDASFAVNPGTNDFSGTPILLNGIANETSEDVSVGCSGSSCTGSITIADDDGNAITYGGSAGSSTSDNPTSGNAFDNGAVTLGSDNTSVGTVSAGGSYDFVNATGVYSYTATCVAAATGTFNLVAGGGTSTSVAGIANGFNSLTYVSGVTDVSSAVPSFTCANGTIASATGSITAQ